jgi:predicted transcriptional regulator
MSFIKRSKKRINGLDSRIFATLFKAQRPLAIKQIAKRLNISWSTAKIHIEKMIKLDVLIVKKTIRKSSVQINPKFINYLGINNFIVKENLEVMNIKL